MFVLIGKKRVFTTCNAGARVDLVVQLILQRRVLLLLQRERKKLITRIIIIDQIIKTLNHCISYRHMCFF